MSNRGKAVDHNRLRQFRDVLGLTQRQLTEILDCSTNYISRLEHKAFPSSLPPSFVDRIMDIGKAINLDMLKSSTFEKIEDEKRAKIIDIFKVINQDWLLNKSDEMFVSTSVNGGKEMLELCDRHENTFVEAVEYFVIPPRSGTDRQPEKQYIYPPDCFHIIQEADPIEVEKRENLLACAAQLIKEVDEILESRTTP